MDLSMVSLVALEEESGKTTNGLGYMVADRGPRELLELASPEQIERYVMPVVTGRDAGGVGHHRARGRLGHKGHKDHRREETETGGC